MVGRLDLAGDAAFLVAGVEPRDRPGAALARQDVLPAGLDVTAERRHQAQTSHHDTAHLRTPNGTGSNPFGLSLSKPCIVLNARPRKRAALRQAQGERRKVTNSCSGRYSRWRP